MKKACIAASIVLVLGAIVLLVWRANSFSLALSRAGFNAHDVRTIEHSFDSNQQEFKVIRTSSKERAIDLAILTRNDWGFWTVSSRSGAQANPNLDSIGWIRSGGAKSFGPAEDVIFEHEWHIAYYGNNATKRIEFLPGQIPENVTVNVQQAGESFLIHIVTFAEPDVLNSIDMHRLLVENQCIAVE